MYKRQGLEAALKTSIAKLIEAQTKVTVAPNATIQLAALNLSLIHISEPTRPY